MKNFILTCSVLLTTMVPAALAQTTFTKITTGPVVSDGADGEGCAWVDFDNDGDLDLYVSCDNTGANLLYRNDGNGVFTKITTGSIVTDGGRSISASWADMDNDGRVDLFVSKQSGRGLLFRQNMDGTFTRSALSAGGFSWGASWADYDNDGFADLVVADNNQSIVWHNNGTGDLTATTTPITTANASSITWTDYDGDGDLDLFVANYGADSRLYRNDNGAFTAITSGPLAVQSANGTGTAWGDYDNDGFPDLILGRLDFSRPLPSFLYHNNGDGTFGKVDQAPFTEPIGQVTGGSWGDYDNDGWLDLFVSEYGGEKNRLFHNNGDGTFTRILSGSIANDNGSSTAGVWGDYDGDGFLDLFVANGVGANGGGESNDFLYHNDGNSNAWITIKCVGTRSNRSAIGTKVRVRATIGGKTSWQMREINTGDGWAGNPLEAHFGLGNATNVEALRIEWPSGFVQTLTNVAPRQVLTIIEPPRVAVLKTNAMFQFSLKGGRGFRYDIEASTNLAAWSALGTITITNFNGTALIVDTNAVLSDLKFYRAVSR